jgi:hypothetical protein
VSSGGGFSASGKEVKNIIIPEYVKMLFQLQVLHSITQDGKTIIDVEQIWIWKVRVMSYVKVILVFTWRG